MSQDLVADGLNKIMNAKRAGKEELIVRPSKVLVEVLKIMKKRNYLDFKEDKEGINIKIKEISECKAIKPRYNVKYKDLERYLRRFLPARNLGVLIISTNKGLMTYEEAEENKTGGSLIAYAF